MEHHNWDFYLFFSLLCIIAQGFFAMFEMACVSFNRVRLQYYASKNNRRALWIQSLLHKPSRLFGTTLIGVITFLQFGSEFARRFYESLGINADYAVISQTILVVIFGELAPMFAARRYPEQVAMLYVPVIYFFSFLLYPIIFCIDKLNIFLQKLTRKKAEAHLFLSREELQKAFEERDTYMVASRGPSSNFAVRFFSLRNKTAKEIMIPISLSPMIPSTSTIDEMKNALSAHYSPFIPLYHRSKENIVAIAYPRDFLRLRQGKKVIDLARPPWFITQKDSLFSILKQFRRNNQSVAVVLGESGKAEGLLTLDDLIDEIFGEAKDTFEEIEKPHVHVERTLAGDMLISEFNAEFHAAFEHSIDETLSDLINRTLKHHPAKGESIRIDQFEFIVEEPSLFGSKVLSVRTVR
ncbi:MAG TPA: hemolysin family protein [Chlamydiales bacterium]|nr:hemolysin family protein [Chlamydiales bacterium]